MRITAEWLAERIAFYEREYKFDPNNGWQQIVRDLKPLKDLLAAQAVPRAVAYGAYSELKVLYSLCAPVRRRPKKLKNESMKKGGL